MKSSLVAGAAVAVIVVAVAAVLSSRRRTPSAPAAEITASLRSMALGLTPEDAGINIPSTQQGVWGVVADFGLQAGTTTVVGLQGGTASLYQTSGEAIIGGESHENVRQAVAALVLSAEGSAALLTLRGPQPCPQPGHVRLYAHSRAGLLASPELSNAELASGALPFSPLFLAVNTLITQLRLTAGAGA